MKSQLTVLWIAVAGGSFAGAMLTAGSASAANYGASVDARVLDTPNNVTRTGSAPVDAFAADVGGPINTHAAPTASAIVNTAGIHLTAVATAQVFTSGAIASVYSTAEARGGFSDQFVISAPGLAGTTGTATVAFVVSGSPSTSGGPASVPEGQGWGSAARWRARFSLDGAGGGAVWEGFKHYNLDSANYLIEGDGMLGTMQFTLPVVFNSTLFLNFSGVVEAQAGAGSVLPGAATLDAFGAMDLGNTIAWGGITELIDANGAQVTNFDATSGDTGFNYAQAYVAVPEPGAGAMLLMGLGVVGLRARRNKEERRG